LPCKTRHPSCTKPGAPESACPEGDCGWTGVVRGLKGATRLILEGSFAGRS